MMKPLYDHVVLRGVAEETSKGGIVLPGSAKEKPQLMEVVAVGEGRLISHGEALRGLTVKVGDKVVVNKYAGNEIKLDGIEYTIVREDDILAIID